MLETKAAGFKWWLPMVGAAGAIVLVLPQTIFGNVIGAFLAQLLLAFVICVTLLAITFISVRRNFRAVLAMISIFIALAWTLFKSSDVTRTTCHWLLGSKDYKTQVLDQPTSSDGSLKHIEWDGWGFPGAGDTTVYLVFDPNDLLSEAANSNASGKFSGVPCAVVRIHRLETHWYSVLFYTDTAWGYCG